MAKFVACRCWNKHNYKMEEFDSREAAILWARADRPDVFESDFHVERDGFEQWGTNYNWLTIERSIRDGGAE